MHFCHFQGLHNDPVLKLGSVEIPVVEQYKFLGVIFDKKLSFILHINYLKTSAIKLFNSCVLLHIRIGELINLLYLNYIAGSIKVRFMVVLSMDQPGSLIFAVLTPFITWVYNLHLVNCELLPSRVSMLRPMRLH